MSEKSSQPNKKRASKKRKTNEQILSEAKKLLDKAEEDLELGLKQIKSIKALFGHSPHGPHGG